MFIRLRDRLNRRGYLALIVIAVMLCGACSVCSTALALTTRQPTTAYEAQVCVGLVTTGYVQAGVWWQMLFMSRLMPATLSPFARCVFVPWSPSLPPAGEIAFPP